MAQYYFAVFQALFTKDNEAMRPMISDYLSLKDPMLRSRKLINLYEEMHGIIDKKMFYVHKTAEEFKERSKTQLLEHAYQKVLEENKKSDKSKYQEKLDAVKHMPDSVRKVLQEEINGLEAKSDMDNARKTNYLTQVFRLPWDDRVDPYWDVQYSREVLENSHYGMQETKERILEFIAKNKRINSQKGMVLLLTGPPGVGKTSIAKSIGECLKRPTTIISMGGQNDPMHIKGSKRTYVDSQPGIFVKELQRLECKNPVIVIDEIDKVGYSSMKGDISSTLLELLNPEQSNQFRDSFLDLEFDFSECIYICTSNSVANMLQPLLDRIEVINVPAYLPIEKMNIAKTYLMPLLSTEYGFNQPKAEVEDAEGVVAVQPQENVVLTDAAIMEIINKYCGHEAGVRNLRKALDRVFRKIVAKIEYQSATLLPEPESNYQVNSKNLEKFLDIPMTDDTFY
jgi:endopeptidase La